MQKKIYTIKERIKEIAINKGIPLGKYFQELEISSTGFSGEKLKNAINSDVIQKIICKYPDVDLNWLITGKEEKKEKQKLQIVNEPPEKYGNNYREKYIEVLEENRKLHKELLMQLKKTNA